MNYRLRIPDWLLLPGFCAFFFLWRLASFGLIGADEPRYAQVAREMLARHDWVTPTLGGIPWLEKPPFYYWQAMASYSIFGVSDWAARLPSVLDASLLAFAAYWFLRRFRAGVELDGALMLVASAGIAGYARAASTDMPLAATFGIAMLEWFAWLESKSRTSLFIAYVFLGLAMLAKGPVAPFLALAIILIFSGVRRGWIVLRGTLWWPGIAGFCGVALPWYVLVQLRNPQFFRVFVIEHNFARFGTNMFHHSEPFWYYVPVTLLGWMPWSVFAVLAIVAAVRNCRDSKSDPLNQFLIVWIVVAVVFFSISNSKLPGYILPALPAGIILLANFIRQRQFSTVHPLAAVLHGLLVAALIFGALVSPLLLQQHHLAWDRSVVSPLIAAILGGGLISVILLRSGFAGLHMAGLAPAIITLALAIRFDSHILDTRLSARPVSDSLAADSSGHLPVAVVLVPRELEFGLQFYRNQPIPRYELHQAPGGEHLVVAHEGFANAFTKDVPGRRLVYLGRFPAQKVEFFYVGK